MLLSLFIGIEFGGAFGWGSYNTKSTSSLITYHGATAYQKILLISVVLMKFNSAYKLVIL